MAYLDRKLAVRRLPGWRTLRERPACLELLGARGHFMKVYRTIAGLQPEKSDV